MIAVHSPHRAISFDKSKVRQMSGLENLPRGQGMDPTFRFRGPQSFGSRSYSSNVVTTNSERLPTTEKECTLLIALP